MERGGLEEGQTSLGLPCERISHGEITMRAYEDHTSICTCSFKNQYTLEISYSLKDVILRQVIYTHGFSHNNHGRYGSNLHKSFCRISLPVLDR